jgi:hypothetical protein
MHVQLDVVKLLLGADADPYAEDKLAGYVPCLDTLFTYYAYQVITALPLT